MIFSNALYFAITEFEISGTVPENTAVVKVLVLWQLEQSLVVGTCVTDLPVATRPSWHDDFRKDKGPARGCHEGEISLLWGIQHGRGHLSA